MAGLSLVLVAVVFREPTLRGEPCCELLAVLLLSLFEAREVGSIVL